MKKRIISLLMAYTLIICLLPVQALADEPRETVTRYADGSYIVTSVEESLTARVSGTKSGTAIKNYYSNDDVLQWKAVLDATFTYNGSSATCTKVNGLNVTIYDSSWSVGSKSTSKSGNTAYGYLTMRGMLVGGEQGVPVTLTLTCDRNGNLS